MTATPRDRIVGTAVVVVLIAVGTFLGSALGQWQRDRSSTPERPREAVRPAPAVDPTTRWDRVRVEVLNGGGRSGMAASATDHLRQGGFDVVYFGNASSFDRDSTVVVDRVGKIEMARAVAQVLGVDRVVSEPDSTLYVDVTVVLGSGWEPTVLPEANPPEPRPWWDPRGWFRQPGDRGPELLGPVKSADPEGNEGSQ